MRATWRMLAGQRDLRLVLSAGIISVTGEPETSSARAQGEPALVAANG
jgi:hypothetical protein